MEIAEIALILLASIGAGLIVSVLFNKLLDNLPLVDPDWKDDLKE